MEGVANPGTSFSFRQNIGGTLACFPLLFAYSRPVLPLFLYTAYILLDQVVLCAYMPLIFTFYILLYIYGSLLPVSVSISVSVPGSYTYIYMDPIPRILFFTLAIYMYIPVPVLDPVTYIYIYPYPANYVISLSLCSCFFP